MVKTAIIAFGRFNPPTTGHAKLVKFIRTQADRLGADVLIFPSHSQDPKRNPLPFKEKVRFLRMLFPNVEFAENDKIRTPIHALALLSEMGYDQVFAVVGSDRVAEFQKFGQYVSKHGKRGKDIVLQKYGVIPVPGDRDPDAESVEGMSASKMRAAAANGNYAAFALGVPTKNKGIAKQLYASVRRNMGLKEALEKAYRQAQPVAILVHGNPQLAEALSQTPIHRVHPVSFFARTPEVRSVMEMRDVFFSDVTQCSAADVRQMHRLLENAGYKIAIYLCPETRGPLSESAMRVMTTAVFVQEALARDAYTVQNARQMMAHMVELLEAAGDKPKEPTEVDRLKNNQKQQLLLVKQRQSQEMLQAKQRELQKKSREDMNKIRDGSKPRSVTR